MIEKPRRAFYLACLSNKEILTAMKIIDGLITLSNDQHQSDPLGEWLFDALERDAHRRANPEIEPEALTLPNWTGVELARALKRAQVLSYIGMPHNCARLADWLVVWTTAQAAQQLEKMDLNHVKENTPNAIDG